MGGQRSYIVILIASAFAGGAAAVAACWSYGAMLAVLAAPLGGSFTVLCVALLLYCHQVITQSRMTAASFGTSPADVAGRARWLRRSDVGAGG